MKLGPIQTKWVESLEAHPERQSRRRLGVHYSKGRWFGTEYTACCLGEGGLIAGVCHWNNGRLVTDNGCVDVLSGCYEALGLFSEDGDIRNCNTSYDSLADMNDDNNVTWPDIAAFIRKNPEAVFCRSV